MMRAAPTVDDLSLADLETAITVAQTGSVSGAARSRSVTPSQVSKALARVEGYVGFSLFARSSRGLRLSDAGRDALPRLLEIVGHARALREPTDGSELSLIALAFLNACLAPAIAAALPDVRIHILEAQPGVPTALSGLPMFDVALATGEQHWPPSWNVSEAGSVRRALYASPRLAARLGPRPSIEKLRAQTFIGAIYRDGGISVFGDDGCPISVRERRFGHRTQTAALALQLAVTVDQLVFAPAIAARHHVAQGELVEIGVARWSVREPLYLVCHGERVGAKVQRAIIAAIRDVLRESA